MDIKMPKIKGVDQKYVPWILGAVAILVIYILFKGFFDQIFGSIQEGLGLKPSAGQQQEASDINWLADYEKNRNSSDCFSPNLYDNNPGAASIDSNTASNLWQNVKDCNGWFSKDMSNLQGQFQQVVGNQVDISFVARKCMDEKGKDLFNYMAYTFDDDANYHYLNSFIQWANSLPTT